MRRGGRAALQPHLCLKQESPWSSQDQAPRPISAVPKALNRFNGAGDHDPGHRAVWHARFVCGNRAREHPRPGRPSCGACQAPFVQLDQQKPAPGPRGRWTSAPRENGRLQACPPRPSSRMNAPCASFADSVLQQRPCQAMKSAWVS